MAELLPAIPPPLVERFAKAFAAFVDAVRDAVAEAARNPELVNTKAFGAWQGRALPLLQQDNASILEAQALFQKGDVRPILAMAESASGLAKKLDGFPLDFAGPDRVAVLDRLETAVVVAAYHVCAAAGIP